MRISRSFWLLFAVCACVLAATADRGRTQPLGSMVDLKKGFDETSTQRGKLLSGEVEKPTAADKRVAEATARYFIYRITHKSSDPAKVQNEFEKFVSGIDPKKKNHVFVNQYLGPALVTCMKDVLANDPRENPSVAVNGGMMLSALARVRSDDIGDYLMFLVEDSQANDVVRLYALKAFKERLPVRVFDPTVDDGVKEHEARKLHDIKHVAALARYIERSAKVTDAGDLAVVRYLRRDAITSLANSGAPSVSLARKGKVETVEGPIAPTLLRVIVTDGLQPPASLQEKIEAAVGLCALKYPEFLKYDPDIAVFYVGRTLAEMSKEYNKDYGNFGVVDKSKKLPMIAWKTDSKRLELGLKEMVKSAGGKGNAVTLDKYFTPILKQMQGYKALDFTQADYTLVEQQIRPKSGAVFKTMKADIVVPLN